MKPISIDTKRAVELAAVLFSAACIVSAADDAIPLIRMVDVPLADAIKTLARQSHLNYILDPHVPGSDFGPGRLAPKLLVTANWTNVTAQAALSALLKEHSLTMVTNPATTVTRIAPANLSVKPVPTSQVGTDTSDIIPLLVMESVFLSQAVTQLARSASLAVSLDPKLSATDFDAQGAVSFRWERITARQALAALLDNYDLVMIEDPATSAARITQKFTAIDSADGPSFYAIPKQATPNKPDAGDGRYEIVLVGEHVVFDKAESVSSQIIIRNLGVKKMIVPGLYWGLSVVWDGKEYKRDPKHIGVWNGPGEIIPKGVLGTGFSLSEYLVPAEALTAGRHTIAMKDAFAESNTLKVFIEKTSADQAAREAQEEAGRPAKSTNAPALGPVTGRATPSAADEAAWGEPFEGVSVRLRADKTRWTTNETPTFKLEVRNQGQREFVTFQGQESGRVEVDGVWYDWTGPIDLKGSSLPPGRDYHDISVSLGSNWKATQEWRDKTQVPPPQIPLKLLPGKHTIRFAPEIRDITVKPKPQNNYVPCNPVEIEITLK